MNDKWFIGFTVAVYAFGFLLACIVVLPPLAFLAYVLYAFVTM